MPTFVTNLLRRTKEEIDENHTSADLRPDASYPMVRVPGPLHANTETRKRPRVDLPLSPFSQGFRDGQDDSRSSKSAEDAGSYTCHRKRFRGDGGMWRHAQIRDYLVDDPDGFVPNKKTLCDIKSMLLQQISGAVQGLLEEDGVEQAGMTSISASRNYEKVPQLYGLTSETQFFDICKRVYGAGTKDVLYAKASMSYVSMKNFLCSLLAAAVTDWVFDGRHESLPTSVDFKTGISRVYESQVAERKSSFGCNLMVILLI